MPTTQQRLCSRDKRNGTFCSLATCETGQRKARVINEKKAADLSIPAPRKRRLAQRGRKDFNASNTGERTRALDTINSRQATAAIFERRPNTICGLKPVLAVPYG